MQRLARVAYSTLLRLAVPAYVLKLWLRGRAEPLYRFAIEERFGWYRVDRRSDPPSSGWVWVHAVSLGETRAASALVNALLDLRPGMRLLLTTALRLAARPVPPCCDRVIARPGCRSTRRVRWRVSWPISSPPSVS